MDLSKTRLLVALERDLACIKIIGRANVKASVSFKALMTQQRAKNIFHFTLELEECLIMDSTFLGVLANQAYELVEQANPKGSIQLLHPNERVLGLLDNLGVLDLFTIRKDAHFDQKAYETVREALDHNSKEAMTETSLQAHRALIALNPTNREKFEDVTHFLEKELKRQKKATE
jgi:anti-sigma B factor antagonist